MTARLAIMAIVIEFTLADHHRPHLGAAQGQASSTTRSLVVSLIFVAMPIFVLAFVAQYFLAIQLGWFKPTVGARTTGATCGCRPSCWA